MDIFITEKPSVAMTYAKALKVKGTKNDGYLEGYSPVLGKDIQITWAVGHLITLGNVDEQREGKKITDKDFKPARWSKDTLPIIPQSYVYKENPTTYKQFNVVKKLYKAKDVDTIYYAGDSGREGIYIQALIRNQIFNKKFDDLTTPSNVKNEKVVWIDSQTDETIINGIKTAKPYSAYKDMIASGYKRAIADWLIGMNFTQVFTLTSGGLIIVGRVMTPTLAMIVKRQKEIDEFVKTDYYGIKSGNAKWRAVEGSRFFDSPALYNDTGFLKKADAEDLQAEFKKSGTLTVEDVKTTKKTEYAPLLFNLADLQNLCSKTLHISPDQTLAVLQSLYEKKFTTYPRTDARVLSSAVAAEIKAKTGKTVPKKYVDDSKITDHYALVPTDYCTGSHNPASLSSIEKTVYEFVCNRFKAVFMPPYTYDSIAITYTAPNGEKLFETRKHVTDLGFKALYGEKDDSDNLPAVAKGQIITNVRFEVNAMETTPPSYYNTGSLILAMEKAGKLIEDEELREQIKTCGIGTSATRGDIIKKLAEREYIKIDKNQKVTPTEAGKQIIPVIATFDNQLVSPEKTAFLEEKLSDIAKGGLSPQDFDTYIDGYVKDTVKNVLNNVEKSEIHFNKAGKGAKEHNCPCCNKALSESKFGWYCNPKKDGCGFSLDFNVFEHKMKESDLEDLINKGKTKAYTFTWKSGKKSKARLILDKDNHKTGFEFVNEKTYSKG